MRSPSFSGAMDDRITELELRFMRQQDLLEQLDEQLTAAIRTIEILERRAARTEQTLEQLLKLVDVPANEKPPHY